MPESKVTNPRTFLWDFPCLEMHKVLWSLPVVLPVPCMLATTLLLCMPPVCSHAMHLEVHLKGNKQSMIGLLVTFSEVLKENSLLLIEEFSKVLNTLPLKNMKLLSTYFNAVTLLKRTNKLAEIYRFSFIRSSFTQSYSSFILVVPHSILKHFFLLAFPLWGRDWNKSFMFQNKWLFWSEQEKLRSLQSGLQTRFGLKRKKSHMWNPIRHKRRIMFKLRWCTIAEIVHIDPGSVPSLNPWKSVVSSLAQFSVSN